MAAETESFLEVIEDENIITIPDGWQTTEMAAAESTRF